MAWSLSGRLLQLGQSAMGHPRDRIIGYFGILVQLGKMSH